MKAIRRVPPRRHFIPQKPKNRINENIWAPEVRVVDEDGNQLGIFPVPKALELAKERELDLVEIAPLAHPPVCRIIDYGKFQYQQSKRDQQGKSKQKKIDLKVIRIGIRTDTHDLDFKKSQAEKFLKKGDKVKLEIILRGREKAHFDLARRTLEDFLKTIQAIHKTEQEIKRFPGGFNTIISPE